MPGPLGWFGVGAGFGLVAVGVGDAPEAARVVGVARAAGPEVAVVAPALRAVVAVVLAAAAGAVVPGTAAGAAVVAVVSAVAAVELVTGGAPAMNWPPRRKEGGPLSKSLYPTTPATRSVTDDTPAMIFMRLEGPRDTAF